jgi:hypothetical protein
MTPRNSYATLAEYKNFVTARGQTPTTDATDDGVIEQILEAASRFLDSQTSRWFYPRIETRYHDLPGAAQFAGVSELDFDADVLEILTLLNGDGTSIAAAEYNLRPKNESPKYGLRIKANSTLIWEFDSDGNWEKVLALTALFGYHNRYADAWKTGGTLGAAITDTTGLSATMAAGHTLASGQIWRVDNEILIGSVSTNTLTFVKRGDNGSTAATHLNGATVSIWQPMEEARNAVCEIANTAYRRRFGQSLSNTETTTGAGVVLSPRDVPAMAAKFIATYRRYV